MKFQSLIVSFILLQFGYSQIHVSQSSPNINKTEQGKEKAYIQSCQLDDSFVVVWSGLENEPSTTRLNMFTYFSNTTLQFENVLVIGDINEPPILAYPSVFPNCTVLVTWNQEIGSSTNLYMGIFSYNGTSLGGSTKISSQVEGQSINAIFNNGEDFIIVYQIQTIIQGIIYLQNGEIFSYNITSTQFSSLNQENPFVAIFPNDSYVITWSGMRSNDLNSEIWASIYDPNWNPISEQIQVTNMPQFAGYGHSNPIAIINSVNLSLNIIWQGISSACPSNPQIYMRNFEEGTVSPGESVQLACLTNQSNPFATYLTSGIIVVVWEQDSDPSLLKGRAFVGNITVGLSPSTFPSFENYNQSQPTITARSHDRYIIAWKGMSTSSPTIDQIYAHIYPGDDNDCLRPNKHFDSNLGYCVQCNETVECNSGSCINESCYCIENQECWSQQTFCNTTSSSCEICTNDDQCAPFVCTPPLCVECVSNTNCVNRNLPVCIDYQCEACGPNAECSNGQYCNPPACVECLSAQNCTSSLAAFCNNDGECVQCLSDLNCNGEASFCQNYSCTITSAMEALGTTASKAISAIAGTSFGASLGLPGGSSQFIRMSMAIETLFCLNLLNVQYPPELQAFLNYFKVINLQSFPNPINWFVERNSIKSISPSNFEANGITGIFLQDAGQYLFLYFLMGIIQLLASFLIKWKPKTQKVMNKLVQALGTPRIAVIAYAFSLVLFVSLLSQVIYVRFDSSLEKLSFIIALVMLGFYGNFVISIFKLVERVASTSKQNAKQILISHKDLFDGFITSDATSTNSFIIINLLKNFLQIILIIGLFDSPRSQVFSQVLILGGFKFIILKRMPFADKKENVLNIILYGILTLAYLFILPFTLNDHNNGNQGLGRVIIALCLSILIILILLTILETFRSIKKKFTPEISTKRRFRRTKK